MALNAVIGALRVNLGLDSAAFTKGLSAADKEMKAFQRKIDGVGKTFQSLGTKLSLAVTLPLVGLASKSVEAFGKQERAVAAVEAALASMGEQAGFTSQELQNMAANLQGNTLFGDEDILDKVTANLLTFGNVTGKVFERAQVLALDLSARLGQDLKSSAIQLGKALNDPIKGISALSEVGVSFTEQQKEQIKAMAETGRVAEAQGLILAELERQYAGQAAALAKLDSGKITQAWNRIGDAMEKVGAIVLPVVASILEKVADLADAFSKLDPATQKLIVGIGGLAAALGPATIALGVMVSSVSVLLPVLAAMAGPLAIIAAVVGVAAAGFILLADNSKKVEQPVYDAAAAVAAINGELDVFYQTTAPKAGKSAIDLANDYVKLAEKAYNAAAANLALAKADLGIAKAQQAAGTNVFFGREAEAQAAEDLADALAALEQAEKDLEETRRGQFRAVNAVTGATYDYADAAGEAGKETKIVIEGLDDIGTSGGRAAKGMDEFTDSVTAAAEALEETKSLLRSIFDGFRTGGIRGAFDELRRAADNAFNNILVDAFSKGGKGIAGVIGSVGDSITAVGAAIGSVFTGGGLASIGGLVSAALPLVGAISAVSAILKGLIGTKKIIGQGFDLGVVGGDIIGGQFTTTKRTALFGLLKSTKTKVAAFDDALAAALQESVNGVQHVVRTVFGHLGVEVSDAMVAGVDLAVTRFDTRGLSEAEIEEKFAEVFDKYGDALSEAISGISLEAATLLASASAILKPAGQLFFGTIANMADAAGDLVTRIGGIDALASSVSYFTDNFFTKAERIAALSGIVADAFAPLDIEVPKTVEAFKQLVLAQNLMTETGRETYAALLAIAPVFKEIAGAASAFGAFDFSDKRFNTIFEDQVAQIAAARNYDLDQIERLGGSVMEAQATPTLTELRTSSMLLDRIADTLDRMEVVGIPQRE